MKKGDWYFDGYERRKRIDPDGKARQKLIYTGEYYGFPRGQNPRPLKLAFLGLTLLYFSCYFINAVSNCAVAKTPFAGMPMMLSLLPGIYLLIGTLCFLPAKAEMTVRVCYSSLRRMHRSLLALVFLLAVSVVGCVVYWVRSRASCTSGDLLYIVFAAAAFAGTLLELILLRKNPVVVVRNPTPDSIRSKEFEDMQRKKQQSKHTWHKFRKNR